MWESLNEEERWKNAVEGKGLRVNVYKTKGMKVLFGKKSSVLKVDPCGSVVCGLVVILFNVRNVRDGFIVIVLMHLGRRVYRALARKLKLMTFFQNWEIRVVFTKSPYREWRHIFFCYNP